MRLFLHFPVIVLQCRGKRPQSLAATEQFRAQKLQELGGQIVPRRFAKARDEVLGGNGERSHLKDRSGRNIGVEGVRLITWKRTSMRRLKRDWVKPWILPLL